MATPQLVIKKLKKKVAERFLDSENFRVSSSNAMWLFRRKGPSGFSSSSTAEEVTDGIDATGLTAIVTGPNLLYFCFFFAFSIFHLNWVSFWFSFTRVSPSITLCFVLFEFSSVFASDFLLETFLIFPGRNAMGCYLFLLIWTVLLTNKRLLSFCFYFLGTLLRIEAKIWYFYIFLKWSVLNTWSLGCSSSACYTIILLTSIL